MSLQFRLVLLCSLVATPVLAQRDPPIVECYLPSVTIAHGKEDRLTFDIVFKKETGAVEHREHQMYLIGYLVKDEAEVLKISRDVSLLDKGNKAKRGLFLDVLLKKRLVTVIDTKVAKRQGFAGQDVTGKYADGSGAGRDKESFLKLNTFSYRFSPKKEELFQAIKKLNGFQTKTGDWGYYPSEFKFLIFVPVNDCKYATRVADGIRGKNDFARYDGRVDAKGRDLARRTPILYIRPLSYELAFRKARDTLIVYIN